MSENTNFTNRKGSNLNRRKLTIVSQTPNEMIVDIERADSATIAGSIISADTLNNFQDEIDTANSNASSALSTANSASTTAQTANTTANSANQTATSADTKATTALSNSQTAVTTANEAKAKALEVEGKLADRGAIIKINGASQTEINFTSDPQTQINAKLDSDDLLNKVYPVGAVYISVSNTSPATLFGGTWEAINDRFLLAAGSTYVAGSTGGEASHTLTESEMPSHTHMQNAHTHGFNNAQFDMPRYGNNIDPIKNDGLQNINLSLVDHTGDNHNFYSIGGDNRNYQRMKFEQSINSSTATNQSAGGGQAHNNMPPYLVVYMWKRTA